MRYGFVDLYRHNEPVILHTLPDTERNIRLLIVLLQFLPLCMKNLRSINIVEFIEGSMKFQRSFARDHLKPDLLLLRASRKISSEVVYRWSNVPYIQKVNSPFRRKLPRGILLLLTPGWERADCRVRKRKRQIIGHSDIRKKKNIHRALIVLELPPPKHRNTLVLDKGPQTSSTGTLEPPVDVPVKQSRRHSGIPYGLDQSIIEIHPVRFLSKPRQSRRDID